MPDVPPLLEVAQLSRRHPDRQRWLLRDIALSIQPGERVALVGPSGAGKTLLLRALVLLDPCDHGHLRWRGQPVGGETVPAFRRQAIYLPQRPSVGAETVEDALRQPYTLQVHRDRSWDRAGVLRWLADFGRDATFLEKQGRELSGGERQITALIRALQLEPTLLLLDEPTAALDGDAVAAAEAVLDRWQKAAAERALIWVTHDAALARRVSQRIIAIREGTLEAENLRNDSSEPV